MPDLSRRTLLRASAGVAAIAVPMSALAACDPSPTSSSSAEPELKPEELEAFGADTVVFHVRDASKGEVSILQGSNEVVVQRQAARRARHPRRKRRPGRVRSRHVIPPRSTRDLQGSRRRQHRHLRLRQPRPARHRHDHHATTSRSRTRPAARTSSSSATTCCTGSTSTTTATAGADVALRVPVQDHGHEPEHVPVQHRSDHVARQPQLQPARRPTRCTEVAQEPAAARSSAHEPDRRRRATSGLGRRRTTPTWPTRRSTSSPTTIAVFAGQRLDGFYVDLGVGVRPRRAAAVPEPAPDPDAAPAPGVNALRAFNVHTIAIQVPITAAHPGRLDARPTRWTPTSVIGVWASAHRQKALVRDERHRTSASDRSTQVSRLGNPLFNEVHRADGAEGRLEPADTPDGDSEFAHVRRATGAREAAAGPLPGRVPEPRGAARPTAPTCSPSC